MKINLFFTIIYSFLIVSCNYESEDLTGYWVNENPECTTLCSFTVVKKDSALSDLFVYFDKGPFYLGVTGPLIKKNNNIFIINGSSGDYLLRKKDGFLYNKSGDKFIKTRNPVGRWSDISGKCHDLCEFEIMKETDSNRYYAVFNNGKLNNYYDGTIFRNKDGSLAIYGIGGVLQLTPDTDGNLTSKYGAIYRKKSD